LSAEIKGVRSELSAEIKTVRSELKGEIGKLDERIGKLDEKVNTNHKELMEMLKDSISESNKYTKSLIYPFYWILGIFIPSIIGMFLYLLQK
ncbi:hypothetical protein F0310_05535, partial (plasmid) [Borrelia sp. A-FGy1]